MFVSIFGRAITTLKAILLMSSIAFTYNNRKIIK